VVVIFIEISYSLEMVEDQTQIVSNLKVGVLQSLPAEENHLQTRRRNPFAQFLLLYLENAVFFAPAQSVMLRVLKLCVWC
jgi:hypothetical protein